MKPLTVYLDENDYMELKKRAMMKAMHNGCRVSINGIIIDAIKEYLNGTEIRQEDPPLEQTAKTQSIQDSEPPRRDPFNFDNL